MLWNPGRRGLAGGDGRTRGGVTCKTLYVPTMDSTVAVAALGLFTTLLAAVVTSYVQRKTHRESRVFDARVAKYGELVAALYEYERATYSRVKARLENRPDHERAPHRDEAWANNARARAAIGVVALLSGSHSLHGCFDAIRRAIGDMNDVSAHAELKARHEAVYQSLDAALALAKADLSA